MCGGSGSVFSNATSQAAVGTIGQPDTAKTQIGDTAAPMVAQKKKPRSLLSGAATGDTTSAAVTAAGAKAVLGA